MPKLRFNKDDLTYSGRKARRDYETRQIADHTLRTKVVDPADEARWQELKEEYAVKQEALQILQDLYGTPVSTWPEESPALQSACPPHEWVDVGFHWTCLVCKHCNQEKDT